MLLLHEALRALSTFTLSVCRITEQFDTGNHTTELILVGKTSHHEKHYSGLPSVSYLRRKWEFVGKDTEPTLSLHQSVLQMLQVHFKQKLLIIKSR